MIAVGEETVMVGEEMKVNNAKVLKKTASDTNSVRIASSGGVFGFALLHLFVWRGKKATLSCRLLSLSSLSLSPPTTLSSSSIPRRFVLSVPYFSNFLSNTEAARYSALTSRRYGLIIQGYSQLSAPLRPLMVGSVALVRALEPHRATGYSQASSIMPPNDNCHLARDLPVTTRVLRSLACLWGWIGYLLEGQGG